MSNNFFKSLWDGINWVCSVFIDNTEKARSESRSRTNKQLIDHIKNKVGTQIQRLTDIEEAKRRGLLK